MSKEDKMSEPEDLFVFVGVGLWAVFGTLGVTSFIAAAQLWDYPFPRSVLLSATEGFLFAVPGFAFGSQILRAARRREQAGKSAVALIGIAFIVAFVGFAEGIRGCQELGKLKECASVTAPTECTVKVRLAP